ncbi:hypothetical protein GW950_00115 [Candidatus Wolfebacteria bacterium]|nr:hypothetical protein [Candidatus Wolfebacteria bacterium]
MWVINQKFILTVLLLLVGGQFLWLFSTWVQVNIAWLDIPLHFLGGVMVTAFFFYFLDKYPEVFDVRKNYLISLLFTASFIMLIGVLWEFYEFVADYIQRNILNSGLMEMQLEDTLFDLFNDLIGGILTAAIYLRSKFRELN